MIAVKTAFVASKNFEELFSLIEKTLLDDPKTLIFIHNQIYFELCESAYLGANDDGSCKFYIAGECILIETFSSSPIIALASFTEDCGDFKQLVTFRSPKIRYHMHDDIGFQRWLLIQYKTQ